MKDMVATHSGRLPTITREAIDQLRAPSLHMRVRDYLRQIIEQSFNDGDRFYSEAALVQMLKISEGTVHRVLKDLAREGVLVRKTPQGTFVSKKTTQLRSVGIFMPYSGSVFLTRIVDEFKKLTRDAKRGLKIYYTHPEDLVEDLARQIEVPIQEEQVVLLGNPPQMTEELGKLLSRRGYRTINVDTLIPSSVGHYVGVDNRAGIRLGLEHLAHLGHTRVLLLANEPMIHLNVVERVAAFREFVQERGWDHCPVLECEARPWDDIYNVAYEKLAGFEKLDPRPPSISQYFLTHHHRRNLSEAPAVK